MQGLPGDFFAVAHSQVPYGDFRSIFHESRAKRVTPALWKRAFFQRVTFDWVAAEPVCRQKRNAPDVRCLLLVTWIVSTYSPRPLTEIVTSPLVRSLLIGTDADAEGARTTRAAATETAALITECRMNG